MSRLYLFSAAASVAALAGFMVFWILTDGRSGGDPFAQCRTSAIAGGSGAIGGPFELVDHTGRTMTDADLLTRPTLMYFGYTYCPDVCPLDSARNAQATDILIERGHDLQPVFVTVDPDRDTPEVMAEYVSFMHPEMVGLTGTRDQVAAAARAYRAYFAVHDRSDPNYLVDHSTFSYLLLPDHGFVEVFRRDLSPEQLADQIGCFINAS